MFRSRFSVLVLGLLMLSGGAGAQDPNARYELLSSWWLPYAHDKQTLGIFHMDPAAAVTEADLSEAMDELLEAGDDEGLVGAGAVPENALIDNSELGLHGKYHGAVEPVAEGRFGGALRLAGGCLELPVYDKLKMAFTVEAWLKPTAGAGMVYVAQDEFAKPALSLRREADGTLSIWAYGDRVDPAGVPLAADRWTHVVWIVRRRRYVDATGAHYAPADSYLILDGQRHKASTSPELVAAFERLSGRLLVGAAAVGKPGLPMVVDELRASSSEREYYPLDLSWADPTGARELAMGPPYLRDAADLRLRLTFDGTPGAAGQPAPARHQIGGTDGAAWRYGEGMHGQALLAGTGGPSPILPLAAAMPSEQGTVAFWFRPQGWDNRRVQGFHDPMEHVPLLRLRGPDGDELGKVLEIGVLHKKAQGKPEPLLIHPGRWRHVVYTWRGKQRTLYLDGVAAPESTFYVEHPAARETVSEVVIEPGPDVKRTYLAQQTLIDDVQLYDRALAPLEVRNAFARYAPEPQLEALPFAEVTVNSYRPTGTINLHAELLGEGRERVAGAHLRIHTPAGEPLVDAPIALQPGGLLTWRAEDLPLEWGDYGVELTFTDADGQPVKTLSQTHARPQPVWLDNTLGLHPGEVLPSYDPLRVDGQRITMGRRHVDIGADGWPAAIVAVGAPILAGPMRPELTVGGQTLAFAADGAATVTAESPADVTSRGVATAGGVRLSTEIRTHYDGLMRVQATLSPVAGPVTVERFRIEVPYHAERAIFLSYWAGAQNFRAATFHGFTPAGEGVIFDSRQPKRPRDKGMVGSFIPYLLLGDDFRTLAWFAESDRGWTIDGPEPAVAVERRGDQVVLILTILCAPTEIAEPRTVDFAFMPSPFRELRADHRQLAMGANFGLVDDFSKQSLKSDVNGTATMAIFPVDEDWDAVPARARLHREAYETFDRYDGAILYIDRNWVLMPHESTREFRSRWWASGFFRYYRDAADAHLYYMNEWLRRGLTRALYIDDIWLGVCKDPAEGPAYTRPDGGVQPGYEWYDYHSYMERLRWLFHDNDLEPFIWAHNTETPWSPTLSFVDIALEGEYRFPDWGAKRTFPQSWGPGRIRFHNGRKWGYTARWMNKIGNDKPKPPGLEHWTYRQQRSYVGYLMLHDVQHWNDTRLAGDVWREFVDRGVDENPARFIGYWEPESPITAVPEGVRASVYTDGERALLVVMNETKAEATATLTLDPARFGIEGLTAANMAVADVDTFERPPGEDVMRMAKAEVPEGDVTAEDTGDLEDLTAMFEEAVEDDKRATAEAAGTVFYDDRNFSMEGERLTLLVRDSNYRLLLITRKP